MPFDPHRELLDAYRHAPSVLRRLVRDVDAERARWRPAPAEWGVIEVVAHLGDTEGRAHARVRRMLAEDDPALPGYDQEALAADSHYRERDLATELARFEAERAAQLATLAALDAGGWARSGRHSEVGAITVASLTAHMVVHDTVHLAQIARLLDAAP